MRKIILFSLILVSIFSLLSGCSLLGNFRYEDNGDGTCTIMGYNGLQSGDLKIPSEINGLTVIAIGDNASFSYSSFTGSLIIPDSVTTIGERAFYDCSEFTGSLTIPDSVTTIGGRAFSGCGGFTGNLTIPDSVRIIEDSAFSYCSGLTSISIPSSVTSIEDSAFSNCSGLTSISIPSSVTTIGDRAFSGCSSLTSIEVSEQNKHYSSSDGILFNKDKSVLIRVPEKMKKENYVIPDGVTTIGEDAFTFCDGLTSISIPSSVTSIGDDAFYACHGLTSISIPSSVTSIGDNAFTSCSGLTSISIPSSVTSIRDRAFSGCNNLISIEVSEQNKHYSSSDGILFNKDKSVLIRVPEKMKKNYVIPDGVTTIGEGAFSFCDGLTSISIPNSVTTIGESAFSNCRGLIEVEFLGDAPENFEKSGFHNCADGFKIIYDPSKSGWSTPEWNGCPAYPKTETQ